MDAEVDWRPKIWCTSNRSSLCWRDLCAHSEVSCVADCFVYFILFHLIRSSWFIAVVSCQQVKWVRIRTLSPAAQVNKHNPHAEHKKLFTPKCFLPSLSVLIYNSFTPQEASCWQSMTSCLRHKLITLIFLRYYTDSVLFTYTLFMIIYLLGHNIFN